MEVARSTFRDPCRGNLGGGCVGACFIIAWGIMSIIAPGPPPSLCNVTPLHPPRARQALPPCAPGTATL
eukprot:9029120-Pyramimonas_sp.AAC.1